MARWRRRCAFWRCRQWFRSSGLLHDGAKRAPCTGAHCSALNVGSGWSVQIRATEGRHSESSLKRTQLQLRTGDVTNVELDRIQHHALCLSYQTWSTLHAEKQHHAATGTPRSSFCAHMIDDVHLIGIPNSKIIEYAESTDTERILSSLAKSREQLVSEPPSLNLGVLASYTG